VAMKNEHVLLDSFEELEAKEREAFQNLSNKVRASHEREREREERTKYWSLTGSLVGAILGIVGTTIASEVRMRHFREMFPNVNEVRLAFDEFIQLASNGQDQVIQVAKFIDDLKNSVQLNSTANNEQIPVTRLKTRDKEINDLLDTLKSQNASISTRMDEFKRLLHAGHIFADDDSKSAPIPIVYVGEGMEEMLQKTERNLESRMKLQTLITVVAVYTIAGLSLPLIYLYFSNR